MEGYEFTRVYNETPVVQFKMMGHFIADLEAGQVTAVYHDLSAGNYESAPWTSCFRAVVHEGDKPHIASLSFRCTPLMVSNGRGLAPAEYDEQYGYQEDEHNEMVRMIATALEASDLDRKMLRRGLIDLPFWVQVTYARRPGTPKTR